MRLFVVILLACGAAAAQQQATFIQFLNLTAPQIASIQQLNQALNRFSDSRNQRASLVRALYSNESQKDMPDARALALDQIELKSIEKEIAAEQLQVQAKISALLTPAQMALLEQISQALVQSQLVDEVRCGFLLDSSNVPTFAVSSGLPGLISVRGDFAGFLLGSPGAVLTSSGCAPGVPISVRNYFSLSDAQVSGILALEASYESLRSQKEARAAQVKFEIADEIAKASPEAVALGVRYLELAGLMAELQGANTNGRAAARALLTSAQQAKLKSLIDITLLGNYAFQAESCYFLTPPPGTQRAVFIGYPCQLN